MKVKPNSAAIYRVRGAASALPETIIAAVLRLGNILTDEKNPYFSCRAVSAFH